MSRHSKRRTEARAVGTLKAYHEGAHARCTTDRPILLQRIWITPSGHEFTTLGRSIYHCDTRSQG